MGYSAFGKIGLNIVSPLVALWDSFVNALPNVIGGIIVLLFGYLLGEVLGALLVKGLKKAKFEKFIHGMKISTHLEKFDLSHFFGVLLKWYVFIVFLLPAARLAELGELTIILMDFARWMPHFILAILVILFGWIGADIVANKIESTKIKSKHLASTSAKVLIIVFIGAIALEQIGVNLELLRTTFLLIVGALSFGFALAMGLGFGLAMKDDAKKMIKTIKKKL